MMLYERINKGQTYIIAEMSANHAGKKENALSIVHAAKAAGADCLKIQTYTADTLTIDCDNEYFQIHGGLWDGRTLYDLYNDAYTPWEWQEDIKAECDKVGIDFLSTPFDNSAVDFLENMRIEFYKIASFELVDIPLIEYTASKGKPMIISTGMGSVDEIQDAVNAVKAHGNEQIVLLKCSSVYPAVADDMNLCTISDMAKRFDVPIGLSDHSMGSVGAVTAVALGACVIEKHFCLSRSIDNPDAAFSMEPKEFKRMVDDIRIAERAKGNVSYCRSKNEESSLAFRRSVFSVKDIVAGEVFTQENIRCIRPSYGMKPKYYRSIIGEKSTVDIPFGTPIQEKHVLSSAQKRNIMRKVMNNCYLRKASLDDAAILLDWANEPSVRSNSFCTHEITCNEHLTWLKEKLSCPEVCFYILSDGFRNVGQIRLEIENSQATINYSVDINCRGKGYGKMMIQLAEKAMAQDGRALLMIARVKPNNSQSKRVFESLNYDMMKTDQTECVFTKYLF